MVNYNTTFTLAKPVGAGSDLLTFNLRPSQVEIDPGVMIAEHPIPGSNHSIQQCLGTKSTRFRFTYDLHDILLTTYTTALGGTPNRSSDILSLLRTWWMAGTTLTFVCDYVTYVMNEASGISVKITSMSVMEIPTTDGYVTAGAYKDANYSIDMELTHYYAGG